jgi:MYXO-CTERM domain-containing protein
MHNLLAKLLISTSFGQWAATLLALALAALHRAPRHTTPRHHQPLRLPELASATPFEQFR